MVKIKLHYVMYLVEFFCKNTFIYLLHLYIYRKKTGKKYINY